MVGGDVDPDLAGVDQGDVDPALGQGAEHPGGDAGVGPHPTPRTESLAMAGSTETLAGPDVAPAASAARSAVVAGDGEREVRVARRC